MSAGDFLDTMARASQERVLTARSRLSENALLKQAQATAPPPRLVRNTGGFDLIAELKLRSPAVAAAPWPEPASAVRFPKAGCGPRSPS